MLVALAAPAIGAPITPGIVVAPLRMEPGGSVPVKVSITVGERLPWFEVDAGAAWQLPVDAAAETTVATGTAVAGGRAARVRLVATALEPPADGCGPRQSSRP